MAEGPRPRILRLITRLNAGGPARQAIALGRRLPERGYDHLLVTGSAGVGETDWTERALRAGLEVERIDSLRREVDPRADLDALRQIGRILRRYRPHLLHTHTAKAGALGRLAALLHGPRLRVHTFHGHTFHGYWGPVGSWASRTAERLLARATTRIIAISPGQARELVHYRVATPRRIEVIRLGRDLEPFRQPAPPETRERFRAQHGIPTDALLLGFVGRLVPVKDPLRFVRVLAAWGEGVHGVVAGSGELEGAMRREAIRLGVGGRLHLLGHQEDLPPLYRSIDILLLTSRNEGTPMAIIEAFASGVPVVAPAVGGIPDLIGPAGPDGLGGAGLLYPPSATPDRIAEVCRVLARAPDLRARLIAEAHRRSRCYDLDRLVLEIDRLYARLLGRTSH